MKFTVKMSVAVVVGFVAVIVVRLAWKRPGVALAAPLLTSRQLDARTELPPQIPPVVGDSPATLRAIRDQLDRLPSKSDPDELTQAAQQARSIGDLWYADRLLHSALQQYPQHRPARLALAANLYTQTRFDAARRVYIQLHAEDSRDVLPYIGLANVALGEDRRPESAEWLRRALRDAAQTPESLLQLAQKYLEWTQYAEAEAVADRVLQVAPDNLDARLLRASLLMQRGDLPASHEILEGLLHLEPDNARVNRVLAVALRDLGSRDTERIVRLFARAMELDPDDMDTLRLAGDYYRQQQLYRLAAHAYAHLLVLDPYNLEGRYGLARTYASLNMMNQSEEQAKLHQRLRDQELRYQSLHEQVNLHPGQPIPHLKLARFLSGQRRYALSIMEYQIAGSLLPNDRQIRAELTDLYHQLAWGEPGTPAD
jgi:tetratricopeptide (TPR) repeat protein